MFHSGKSLPSFLECNFSQLRLFNPDIEVYFLTDRIHFDAAIFNTYNIQLVDKDKYLTDDIYTFQTLFGRGENDFWTITTTRLIYIANFLKEKNLHDVLHFENDVLIYTDLNKIQQTCSMLYKSLAITVGGPDKAMTGMMFIKSPKALSHFTFYILNLLKKFRVKDIKKQYGMDMVNEMTLLRIYMKEYPELLVTLPIMPFGEYSSHYDKFNSIFDPASWGQYVGGTLDGIPGAKPDDHYIGLLLRECPEYDVVWRWDDEKRKIPYFRFNKQEVKINNLHIHSKNLHLYTN
jgi:hypothetical protein